MKLYIDVSYRMNFSDAYTDRANALPRPMVTSTEGNSYRYVSKAVGGRKKKSLALRLSKRNRTGKKWTRCYKYKMGGKSRKQKKSAW